MSLATQTTFTVSLPPSLPRPSRQPLDALGTVLEGGLLGASDTGYLGARTAASCALSLLVLGATYLVHGSLLGVWVGMKVRAGRAAARGGAAVVWRLRSQRCC